jgi:hypothetical protein
VVIQLTHDLESPFHRELAREDWLKSLARTIESQLRSIGVFQTTEGSGVVSAFYPEKWGRIFSKGDPQCRFEVEVKVSRRDSPAETDLFLALVQYDPQQGTFRFGLEDYWLFEELRARAECERAIDRMISGEIPFLPEFPCPICDGTVRLFLKERGGLPDFMNIAGGASCNGCGFGRELCFISQAPHIMEFVRRGRLGKKA